MSCAGIRATLAGAALLAAVAAPALAQVRVADIRVQGNRIAETRLILSVFGIEPGTEVFTEDVRLGIRKLYERGLFDDIRVEGEKVPEGLVLTVNVVERPLVERVVFAGNDEVSKDDLEKATEQPGSTTVNPRAMFNDLRKIETLYVEKGYRQAKAEVDVQSAESGRSIITYRIREGKKTRVRAVRVEGNQALDDDDITSAMKTKKRHFFRGGDFKQDVFDEDMGRIAARYGEAGYLDARVVDSRLDYDDEFRDLAIVLTVEEGRPYRVGALSVSGNELFTDEQILGWFALTTGDRFDRSAFESGLDAVYGAYAEEGYVYCRLDPQETREDDLVNVALGVEEGVQARIGRIMVSGNYGTREKVVRRGLIVKPGDVFRRSALMRSQREVFSLGFFDDVQLTPTQGESEGEMDLEFTVKERQTGQAMMGAGYSNQYGMTGSLQLAKQNFRGLGQTIDVMWEFGRLGQFRVGFTEPWLFDTPTSVSFQVYHTRRQRRGDAFSEEAAGASLNVGRPFPWLDYTRAYGRTRFESWTIDAYSGASATVRALAGTGKTASVRAMLIRDSTDSPFFPTLGSVSTWSYELAGVWRDRDGAQKFEPYSRVELGSEWYTRAVGPFVLAVEARAGFLKGHSASGEVPIYEKFRLGGTGLEGLRGYSDYEIVPEGNEEDDGGKVMTMVKSELKFPIGGPQFFGLFFFDSGNTWNSVAEAQPTTLKRGAGFGVRFEAPMIGIIGLDYGYGFDRSKAYGGPGWEWHFQIGSMSF